MSIVYSLLDTYDKYEKALFWVLLLLSLVLLE